MNGLTRTPIESMLDAVEWRSVERPALSSDQEHLPFATHEAVVSIAGFEVRCYQLNDGRRIFDVEGINRFFEALAAEPSIANAPKNTTE